MFEAELLGVDPGQFLPQLPLVCQAHEVVAHLFHATREEVVFEDHEDVPFASVAMLVRDFFDVLARDNGVEPEARGRAVGESSLEAHFNRPIATIKVVRTHRLVAGHHGILVIALKERVDFDYHGGAEVVQPLRESFVRQPK